MFYFQSICVFNFEISTLWIGESPRLERWWSGKERKRGRSYWIAIFKWFCIRNFDQQFNWWPITIKIMRIITWKTIISVFAIRKSSAKHHRHRSCYTFKERNTHTRTHTHKHTARLSMPGGRSWVKRNKKKKKHCLNYSIKKLAKIETLPCDAPSIGHGDDWH